MKFRTLGRTGLKVSVVSYGSGGPSNLGQRTGLTDADQDALVRRALDLGINLIDTSSGYGRSEEILGRALKGVPRDAYLMATKWNPCDRDTPKTDPQDLVQSVERSLSRMGLEVIDLMQFHGVVPSIYRTVVERFYGTLKRLQEQGKVRFIGFSERFFADPRHEAVETALGQDGDLWDTIMLKYGVLNQCAARRALPLAQEKNVGILNMASVRVKLTRPEELGALMAEWKAKGFIPRDALPEKDPLGFLAHGEVDSVVSAGYKFALEPPAISTVITGTSRVDNLERNLAALLGPPLPEADGQRLRALFGSLEEAA